MFKISKEFSFDMAHLLDNHDGKCQNLHGHTYKLQVEISKDLVNYGEKKSMVMDFSDLKNTVKKAILDPMDHAFIYDQTSKRESKIAALLQELNSKTFAVPFRTTAEEMARFIFNRLKYDEKLAISAIRLWETPTSFCEYSE
ncbi:6-carboxytetrahydropterin synthase QueD [Rodentibacter sp. Ppn85]|uniref:6-carboxytetrahydropterin synthase QueD n=1 Tax=Rodentibacter sp. Ppn85 TaxID=1908525 RepID=UPI000984C394|nr:6-carboxytetrahydropterin synthase QueD [Rodentibacter sp. Ppn85]OOF65775.1 6-carboxytetrahydropterin synthase QueD [Rodentibacter sp. Ppn85]